MTEYYDFTIKTKDGEIKYENVAAFGLMDQKLLWFKFHQELQPSKGKTDQGGVKAKIIYIPLSDVLSMDNQAHHTFDNKQEREKFITNNGKI